MDTILYHSHFRGWVPVTLAQAQNLASHLNENAVAIPQKDRPAYIASRFRGVDTSKLLAQK